MVEIPVAKLSEEALAGIIDEFILREGTDYGVVEASLETKRKHITAQLNNGKVKIVFDPETESLTLIAVPGRY